MDFFEPQEASEATIKELKGWCDECFELRDKKKKLEDECKEIEKGIRKLQEKIMRVLEHHELTTFPHDRGNVTVSERWSVKTPKTPEEKQAFFDYLKNKGIFEDMVSVNSQTLNAFFKEEQKAFEEFQQTLPPEERQTRFALPGIGEAKRTPTLSMPRSK